MMVSIIEEFREFLETITIRDNRLEFVFNTNIVFHYWFIMTIIGISSFFFLIVIKIQRRPSIIDLLFVFFSNGSNYTNISKSRIFCYNTFKSYISPSIDSISSLNQCLTMFNKRGSFPINIEEVLAKDFGFPFFKTFICGTCHHQYGAISIISYWRDNLLNLRLIF